MHQSDGATKDTLDFKLAIDRDVPVELGIIDGDVQLLGGEVTIHVHMDPTTISAEFDDAIGGGDEFALTNLPEFDITVSMDEALNEDLQFGFAQAVEVLLERSVGTASHPLTYNFIDESVGRLDELPPGKVVAIYRIVQEAINNAVSHANARCITLELRDADGCTTIVIEDDGHGLSAVPWRRTGGLTNMQTRASLIQAELRATVGANGQGTRLELVLPAHAASAKVEEPSH